MTREEINRYIHVEIMDKCWHEWDAGRTEKLNGRREFWYSCKLCNQQVGSMQVFGLHPDYCSDESPRRLMHEVEEAVIELLRLTVKNPRVIYCRYLMVANGFSFDDLGYLYEQVIRSTAEQRAKACVDAHKASKGQPTGEENV